MFALVMTVTTTTRSFQFKIQIQILYTQSRGSRPMKPLRDLSDSPMCDVSLTWDIVNNTSAEVRDNNILESALVADRAERAWLSLTLTASRLQLEWVTSWYQCNLATAHHPPHGLQLGHTDLLLPPVPAWLGWLLQRKVRVTQLSFTDTLLTLTTASSLIPYAL